MTSQTCHSLKIVFFLLLAIPTFLFSQEVDYNRVIPPSDLDGLPLQEKLVRLAWQNYPSNKVLEHMANIAGEGIKQSQMGYLKPVALVFNYGEQNINSSFPEGFFPRYNLAVSVNVGEILATPSEVRAARENHKIAELNVQRQKLFMRAEVIRRYQEYLQKVETMKVLSQIQEDAYTSYLDFTQQFKDGEVSLAEYNEILQLYNESLEAKVKAESSAIIAQTNVEELIGVPLNEVE